jgi:hypothetical protein
MKQSYYVAGAYGLKAPDGRTFASGHSIESFLPDTKPRVFWHRKEAVQYAKSLIGEQILGGEVTASKVLRYWKDASGVQWVAVVHYVDDQGSYRVDPRRLVRYYAGA